MSKRNEVVIIIKPRDVKRVYDAKEAPRAPKGLDTWIRERARLIADGVSRYLTRTGDARVEGAILHELRQEAALFTATRPAQ